MKVRRQVLKTVLKANKSKLKIEIPNPMQTGRTWIVIIQGVRTKNATRRISGLNELTDRWLFYIWLFHLVFVVVP